jgi:uncharacterized protein YdeI (BOF family)
MKGKRQTDSTRLFAVLLLVFGMMLMSAQLFGQPAAPSAQQQYPTQQPGQGPAQQQQPRRAPDQSGQAPDSQAQSQQQPGVQVFTGMIVKAGDKYVLQDSASNTTYDIDHQDEVKQYEGKKVRVHGTLDANGKMIHVQ